MSRFDVAAAREEMARIDADWGAGEYGGAYRSARALLDRALAAIDAGWPEPTGDVVERAALAIGGTRLGHALATKWPSHVHESEREECRRGALAVLRSVGRLPDPVWDVAAETEAASEGVMHAAEVAYLAARLGRSQADWCARSDDERSRYVAAVRGMGPHPDAAPVVITDAMVEEAAIRAWCAPDEDGLTDERVNWSRDSEAKRQRYRNEGRAVLEYAASRGVSPASAEPPKTDDVGDSAERVARALWMGPMSFDNATRATRDAHIASGRRAVIAFDNEETPDAPVSVDTGAAERLTRYRCAALQGLLASGSPGGAVTSAGAENNAHAMLAAERTPANGR